MTETEIPLEAVFSVLPARGGGEELLRKLFEPLGYEIVVEQLPLDEKFPEWGSSSYFKVILRATKRLQDLLAHLYVLIPVLDNEKHYWVGDEEVEKLLRRGNPWLAAHPEREMIAGRYLKFRSSLAREVIDLLATESKTYFDRNQSGRWKRFKNCAPLMMRCCCWRPITKSSL